MDIIDSHEDKRIASEPNTQPNENNMVAKKIENAIIFSTKCDTRKPRSVNPARCMTAKVATWRPGPQCVFAPINGVPPSWSLCIAPRCISSCTSIFLVNDPRTFRRRIHFASDMTIASAAPTMMQAAMFSHDHTEVRRLAKALIDAASAPLFGDGHGSKASARRRLNTPGR